MKYADNRFMRDQLKIGNTKMATVAEAMRRVLAEEAEPTYLSIESHPMGWVAQVVWDHHDGPIPETHAFRKQMWRAVVDCALQWLRYKEASR